jgi:hypothetical protein
MQISRLSRAISFCLAASITLAMLGGIDSLSHLEAAPTQWAQAAHPQA